MNIEQTKTFINQAWDQSIIPSLVDYIKIPNKSPLFDPEWKQHGHMDQAIKLIADWCKQHGPKEMKLDILSIDNRTPVIFMEIPGNSDETILMYGHCDKQPEMTGWDPDLGPWKPVIKDGKLYGRGGADDGYAAYASLTAINALRQQNINHARIVILIEACEESGSRDLPYYIENLKERIGQPSLIICLDSGCGNYEQLWITTSLRGMVGGTLHIDVLKQGVHSGNGSGVVPSCFLVLRQLLNRIENTDNGKICIEELFVEIPKERHEQAAKTSQALGKAVFKDLPFCENVSPVPGSEVELLLNRTWRPALSIVGAEGLPQAANAGNVTLPSLSFKLSMRLAPTFDAKRAGEILKNILEKDPPFNAKVKFDIKESGSGWNAPIESPWLVAAVNEASQHFYGKPALYIGEGGSIPFMGMLGKRFPQAQFVITGVLGPASNAHGPNEFLHIDFAKKLTCCIAEIVEKQFG